MADAELLPFEFTDVADTVHEYVTELHALLKARQEAVKEQNLQLEEGVFAAMNNPRRPKTAPRREAVPPALNFAPLENAAVSLNLAAQRYKKAQEAATGKLEHNREALLQVNQLLMQSERQYLDPKGLPNREWFKHLLYAPGFYTGYSVKTMPGVREGIEQKQYGLIDAEVGKLALALGHEVELINQAAGVLEGMK